MNCLPYIKNIYFDKSSFIIDFLIDGFIFPTELYNMIVKMSIRIIFQDNAYFDAVLSTNTNLTKSREPNFKGTLKLLKTVQGLLVNDILLSCSLLFLHKQFGWGLGTPIRAPKHDI